jgi:hypothetical protein
MALHMNRKSSPIAQYPDSRSSTKISLQELVPTWVKYLHPSFPKILIGSVDGELHGFDESKRQILHLDVQRLNLRPFHSLKALPKRSF